MSEVEELRSALDHCLRVLEVDVSGDRGRNRERNGNLTWLGIRRKAINHARDALRPGLVPEGRP